MLGFGYFPLESIPQGILFVLWILNQKLPYANLNLNMNFQRNVMYGRLGGDYKNMLAAGFSSFSVLIIFLAVS